ncbi:alpha-galactosidase A precursor protein [Rutstroemia sp. NJR-2017a WRK4]|nr:alpha-galactosidase A precursor protein [Rutstroemia sp. NJR-2017a WRK4]
MLYLSLSIGPRLRSNIYEASSPQFSKQIIAKFARFEWEIGYYAAETQVYSWIDGHGIGPEFLGYVTEEGRALHGLGIVHGDLNKHNFLISDGRAVLIDFETAKRSEDREAMEKEMKSLESQLLDISGIGGVVSEDEYEEE